MSMLFTNLRIIMGKHKFVTFLIIVFTAIVLSIFGLLVTNATQAQASFRSFEETYGNKTVYSCGETLSDQQYNEYRFNDSMNLYGKFLEFNRLLMESERFTLISFAMQPVYLFSPEIPERFLYNYELGTHTTPQYYKGRLYQCAKSIQVSESFFAEFDIKLASGEAFNDDDYHLAIGEPIPILLGSEYDGIVSIGEVLKGDYFEKCSFVVKGFIEKDSFFPAKGTMLSCDRYIILPVMTYEEDSEEARLSVLQTVGGIIVSSLGYDETLSQFEQFREQAGLKKSMVGFSYPKENNNRSILDQYSAMTKEVASQFTVMVLIVMLFGVIAATLTLCSALRENRRNFGVEMLCGATRVDIFKVALLFLLTVLLPADALSLLFAPDAMLSIQLAVLCMLLLSSIITAVYIKNMDMHDILGGNE